MNHLHDDSIPEAVAIIGLSGRFPDAGSVAELWTNLCAGVESIRTFTDEELLAAGVEPEALRDPSYVKAGTSLEGAAEFDAAFFGVTPREAEAMDPQHRLFLECAYSALESAGYDPRGTTGLVGVYAGSTMSSYLEQVRRTPALTAAVGALQVLVGNDKDFLPTRVSYKLNLRGPSVNVQTACSTSLVAVHLACQALLEGACDMALAGGASVRFPHPSGYQYLEDGILSPDGHCRAFDADARGTVGGHGVAAVVLKRLSEAERDRDTIWAVIKGSAINNDGSVKIGYTAPGVAGQTDVIRAALDAAGVNAGTIGCVEAHGTATALGDPIEVAALTQAFRADTGAVGFCSLGSIKSNIGHLDAAAGVTGLIKAALQLRHRQLAPSLHYRAPNPRIDFTSSPFFVNHTLRPWLSSTPRRAGVSSFGIGGTNAHVVLEEAPATDGTRSAEGWRVLPTSAASETGVTRAAGQLLTHLDAASDADLADVAYTLQVGREHFPHRIAVVGRTVDGARTALATADPRYLVRGTGGDDLPSIAFLFPGGGAQHVNMGRDLYDTERTYRTIVDRCAEILEPLLGRDLRAVMFPAGRDAERASELLARTALGLPALMVTEYAQARLLMQLGVTPGAMLGHSLGEYTAACLAGVLSLEDALTVVAARSRLMEDLPPGAMVVVPLPVSEARAFLGPEVAIAAINGPALCVASGLAPAIAVVEQRLQDAGVDFHRVRVAVASHSPAVEPMLDEFRRVFSRVRLNPPSLPYLSNRSGTWAADDEVTSPDYWVAHLRDTVRFEDGVGVLLEDPRRVLVEVGPGRALTSIAAGHMARSTGHAFVTTMRHPQDDGTDPECLARALAQIWCAGGAVQWPAVHRGREPRRVPLPTYPFERTRHWAAGTKTSAQARAVPPQDGAAVSLFHAPVWKQSVWPSRRTGDRSTRRRIVLFTDGEGVGEGLLRRFVAHDEVYTVRSGTGFAHLPDDGTFLIRPDRTDDYERLFVLLGAPPDVIVHLWSVTAHRDLQTIETHGFISLLCLAQAIGNRAGTAPMALYVVSSEMHCVAGEASCPEKATLLGPCRVIPQEYPLVTCLALDIALQDMQRSADAVLDLLAAEITSPSDDRLVVFRGATRWTQEFEAVELPVATPRTSRLKTGGTYLLTGGLGGMALEIAEFLATSVRARLVLVSRSTFPEQESWGAWRSAHGDHDATSARIARLERMQNAGAEVLVCRGDVTCAPDMEAVWAQAASRFGGIDGIVHAAGLPGGGIAQLKSIAMATSVLDVKVRGTQILDSLVQRFGSDFLFLCSSMSAVVGGVGHVDYCGANAFLDTFAQSRRAAGGTHIVSADWNTWRSVGMASHVQVPEALRAWRDSIHDTGISVHEGTDAFVRILASGLPHVAVSRQDVGDLVRNRFSYTPPRVGTDTEASPVSTQGRPALGTAHVSPRTPVEQELAELWQELLGVDGIGVHDDFFQLGGHSLLGTRLMMRIRERFDVPIRLRALFEGPTISGLAATVAREQEERDAARHADILTTLDGLSDEEIELEIARRLEPEDPG